MAETDTYDATIIRRGGYRELRQPIKYERGRAVAYRCPLCNGLHPLNPRDWDEARGVYAGRDCGREPRIVAARAKNAAYLRDYRAGHPDYCERERRRMREAPRARRGAAR